jgi:hypothetical protein
MYLLRSNLYLYRCHESTPNTNVQPILAIWQGSQNLCGTEKEFRVQNDQMTSVGYIFNTEEIIKASWINFRHDGGAASALSERTLLPPAVSAKNLARGQTEVLNVCQNFTGLEA